MLFASTQRTLVKDLGPEHFAESFFTTEAAELSADGWRRHEDHTEAEQPLTQEERDQEGIKAAEVLEQGGMGRRGAGYGSGTGSSGVSTNVGDGVEAALEKLKDESAGGVLVQLVRITSVRRSSWRTDTRAEDRCSYRDHRGRVDRLWRAAVRISEQHLLLRPKIQLLQIFLQR